MTEEIPESNDGGIDNEATSRHGASLDATRRAVLALAGGLGMLGMAGGAAASETAARGGTTPAGQTKNIVGPRDWMYDTIQSAHDDLPSDGGHVYVVQGYDSSAESFPVELTKHVRVEGANRGSTTVNAEGAGADVFRISEGDQSYSRSSSIENLRIIGGENGVVLSPDTHVYLGNLMLFNQNRNGVVATRPTTSSPGSFLSYIEDVNVGYGGGSGFDLRFKGVPHATVLNRCTVLRMEEDGARLTGTATQVTGGAYQYNDRNGIKVKDCSAFTVRDAYFESNGQDGDGPAEYADLYAHGFRPLLPMGSFDNEVMGTNSLVIEGNYFNNGDYSDGAGSDVGIFLEEAHGAQIQGNSWTAFHNDGEGFVHIDETCTDVDFHRPSNQSSNYVDSWNQEFFQNDEGYRTRSDGVVQPTDLSTVEGLYEGDRGIHVADDAAPNYRQYVWNDGAWHSGEHTVEFTGDHGYDSGAAVTFSPGEWDGKTIHVDEVVVPEGGFASLLDLQGNMLGHSAYLDPGSHTDVEIEVYEDGSRGITPDRRHPTHWLAAVAHRDSDDNQTFGWTPATAQQVDEPYLEWGEGGPQWVYDGGQSTVVE